MIMYMFMDMIMGLPMDTFTWASVPGLMNTTRPLWILACAWYAPVYLGVQFLATAYPPPPLARNALRAVWFLWNTALAAFSAKGAFHTAQGTSRVLFMYKNACEWPDAHPWGGPIGYWHLAFGVSKIVELGDTVFLAALGKPIPFLHWYHHLLTCAFSFFMLSDFRPYTSLPITINFAVHTIMYAYYAASAIGLRPPRQVAKAITTSQTVQMFIVFVYNIFQLYSCGYSDVLWMGMLMYTLYLVLFLNYYVKRYTPPPPKSVSLNYILNEVLEVKKKD